MKVDCIETEVYLSNKYAEKDWRSQLMEDLVSFHYRTYSRPSRKNEEAWGLSVKDLLDFPKDSLGNELGCFLKAHGYHLISKLENHDVFHVVLAYEPVVIDEIKMQFCLAGSGRRTLSTFATIIIGSLFYPRNILEFFRAYRRGLTLSNFSYQDFKPLLKRPFQELKQEVFRNHESLSVLIF